MDLQAGVMPHLNPKSCSRLPSRGLAAPPSTLASKAAAIASRARRLRVATVVGYQAIVRRVSRKVQRGAYSSSEVIWEEWQERGATSGLSRRQGCVARIVHGAAALLAGAAAGQGNS
jgi:hypothetical protein